MQRRASAGLRYEGVFGKKAKPLGVEHVFTTTSRVFIRALNLTLTCVNTCVHDRLHSQE